MNQSGVRRNSLKQIFANNLIYYRYLVRYACNFSGLVPIVMADTSSATCILQNRDEVPEGAFFLFVSKGFSEAIRLSETGLWPEIGLRTPRVSFHPPFMEIETH